PEIELLYNKGKMHKRVVKALESIWEKQLGVKIKPVEKVWEDYLEAIDITNYDLARSGWVGDYSDPLTFLSMWTTGNGNNDTGWSNDKYDKLVSEVKASKKSPERMKKLLQAEELLLQKGPVIPIYHFAEHVLVGNNVKGYAVHNRNIHQIKDFSLKE
ncbi:MAG: ABC transporter substrate-binding protein, partial [Bradymonadaceae bacterium]